MPKRKGKKTGRVVNGTPGGKTVSSVVGSWDMTSYGPSGKPSGKTGSMSTK